MSNYNTQLLFNKPIPVKIFYLKDIIKPKSIQTQQLALQKSSLAYLSSIIQRQKKYSPKKQQKYSLLQIGQTLHLQKRMFNKNQTIKSQFVGEYKNNHSSNKQTLSHIIGQTWDQQRQNDLQQLTFNKPLPLKYKKRNKRYCHSLENKNFLEKQFQCFLDVSKSKNVNKKSNQIVSLSVTNIGFPREKKIITLPCYDEKINYSIKKTKDTRKRRKLTNTIMAKKNFRHINNFNWMRLSSNGQYENRLVHQQI